VGATPPQKHFAHRKQPRLKHLLGALIFPASALRQTDAVINSAAMFMISAAGDAKILDPDLSLMNNEGVGILCLYHEWDTQTPRPR